MAQAFTPGLVVAKSAEIRRVRELPVPGEILVKVGDAVRAEQVVARAFLPGDLHILRIPDKLGIEPFEVMKGLKIQKGDSVTEKQVLCEHAGLFGLFKTRYESPVEGIVELITERTGHVAVRMAPKPIEVDAYLDGKVTAVDAGKAVTITATGAFVQGIFGVGGERRGTIKIVSASGVACEAGDLSGDLLGKILVSKVRPTLAAIREAANQGAAALITGSIDDEVLAGYLGFDLGIALTGDEDVPMSLIITEGFGDLLMSEKSLKLLTELDGKRASINGATQVRAGALRPEILIPSEGAASLKSISAGGGLQVGSTIRIIRVPYFGQYATVTELPHETVEIETGARARVLRARLEDGKLVTVPRANVELSS